MNEHAPGPERGQAPVPAHAPATTAETPAQSATDHPADDTGAQDVVLMPVAEAPLENCWSRIGSTGDRSCHRLAETRHCRNCDVYADAAARVMRRPISPVQRAAWASELRQPMQDVSVGECSAMVFRLGVEWLMMPARLVAAVAPLAPLHRLPHRGGGALLGVVNVDGVLTPAIDLAGLLGIERSSPAPGGRPVFPRLLVLSRHDQAFALPVDEIDGMQRYRAADLSSPPSSRQGEDGLVRAVLASGSRNLGLLDEAALGHALFRLLR